MSVEPTNSQQTGNLMAYLETNSDSTWKSFYKVCFKVIIIVVEEKKVIAIFFYVYCSGEKKLPQTLSDLNS